MSDSEKKCLLLVDDNEFLLRCLGEHLESMGFEVATAPSAERALKTLDQTAPDLIILDLLMPGMGGMGFLKRILSEEGSLRYPVLILTVRPAADDFCSSVGVAGFLCKTCSLEELVGTIKEILSRPSPVEKEEALPPPRKRILIAEDDGHIVESLKRMFEEVDYEVEVLGSGAEVLDSALASKPAAILMKQVLPGMNGSAVAAEVSRHTELKRVPIVLYDETRAFEGRRRGGYTAPEGVKTFLPTAETTLLFEATQKVLRR